MPKKNNLDIKFNARNLKNDDDLKFFVKNGFVIYKNIFDRKIIDSVKNNILGSFKNLSHDYKKKKIDLISWKWSKAISINHERSLSADKFYKSKYLIEVVQRYLGPDICVMGNTCIYIVDPKIKKYTTSLGVHSDVWSGNSIDSIHFNTFLTNSDKNNSLTFYPSSHLLGLLPVKNRKLDDQNFELDIKPYTLNNINYSDVVIFHPLLLHSTSEKKENKKLRVAIGDRFKSLNVSFSSQETGLGYRVVNLGPINHIKRVVGNDYMQPFRVHGGPKNISYYLHDTYRLLNSDKDTNSSIEKFFLSTIKNKKK